MSVKLWGIQRINFRKAKFGESAELLRSCIFGRGLSTESDIIARSGFKNLFLYFNLVALELVCPAHCLSLGNCLGPQRSGLHFRKVFVLTRSCLGGGRHDEVSSLWYCCGRGSSLVSERLSREEWGRTQTLSLFSGLIWPSLGFVNSRRRSSRAVLWSTETKQARNWSLFSEESLPIGEMLCASWTNCASLPGSLTEILRWQLACTLCSRKIWLFSASA